MLALLMGIFSDEIDKYFLLVDEKKILIFQIWIYFCHLFIKIV
jgi:hypothetical protein